MNFKFFGGTKADLIVVLLILNLVKDFSVQRTITNSIFDNVGGEASSQRFLTSAENFLRGGSSTIQEAGIQEAPSPTLRPNDHNRTLSHVVVPLHEKQIQKLRFNMQLWVKHPPCVVDDNTGTPITNAKTQPTLVFHLSYSAKNDSDSEKELSKKQCMQAFESLPESVKRCFATAYVETIRLEPADDQHALGARLAFESFLKGEVTAANNELSSYALYMEPDMIPVRDNWLSHVTSQVEWPIPEFWIKGSIFRGSKISSVHPGNYKAGMMHLNGNALYNLASDDFRNFYFEKLRPYVVKKHNGDSRNAYDTDFYEYLDDKRNYPTTREIYHFFQYTDLIQNNWHSTWSAEQIAAQYPNTALVHGGLNTDVAVHVVQ